MERGKSMCTPHLTQVPSLGIVLYHSFFASSGLNRAVTPSLAGSGSHGQLNSLDMRPRVDNRWCCGRRLSSWHKCCFGGKTPPTQYTVFCHDVTPRLLRAGLCRHPACAALCAHLSPSTSDQESLPQRPRGQYVHLQL